MRKSLIFTRSNLAKYKIENEWDGTWNRCYPRYHVEGPNGRKKTDPRPISRGVQEVADGWCGHKNGANLPKIIIIKWKSHTKEKKKGGNPIQKGNHHHFLFILYFYSLSPRAIHSANPLFHTRHLLMKRDTGSKQLKKKAPQWDRPCDAGN